MPGKGSLNRTIAHLRLESPGNFKQILLETDSLYKTRKVR